MAKTKATLRDGTARPVARGPCRRPAPGVHPPPDPAYRSTALRHPAQPLVVIPQTLSELTGPVYPYGSIGGLDHDLTRQHAGAPIGERIAVEGRVVDEDGRPVPDTLVEIWRANAAGRYAHDADTHDAPLDPNFSGAGRTLTDAEGRYRFVSILPARYRGATITTRGGRRASTSRCSARAS